MPTAILSALAEEQHGLLEQVQQAQCHRHAGREFWSGRLHGQPVLLALSRIGKVAAATTATALIERFGARCIVFTGVAGGLADSVQVGDIVVADGFVQHDMDASPLFARYEVPLYGLSRFATDAVLSGQLAQAAADMINDPHSLHRGALVELGIVAPRLHRGLVVSGDRFVATSAESQALRQHLPDALAVEMEGAAIAQVCHDYGVPFAAVRTVSDRADDQAHLDFPSFMRAVAGPISVALIQRLLRRC